MIISPVRFEKRNFLLPWVGLTLVTPALFLFHLASSLLFLQLGAAAWLLLHEGALAAVTLYLVHTVYCLYLEMAPNRVDIFDEEQTGLLVFYYLNVLHNLHHRSVRRDEHRVRRLHQPRVLHRGGERGGPPAPGLAPSLRQPGHRAQAAHRQHLMSSVAL